MNTETQKTIDVNANFKPLPGQTVNAPVLFMNLGAGHGELMDAADQRFAMLRTITDLAQCAQHFDPGAQDVSDMCQVLHVLIREAQALADAAYHLALEAGRAPERAA